MTTGRKPYAATGVNPPASRPERPTTTKTGRNTLITGTGTPALLSSTTPSVQEEIIEILHPGGIPAHDMPVTIKQGRSTIFKGRSYADGRVMFFPEDDRASRPFTIHIKGNKETFIEKVTPSYRPSSIVIDETPPRMANQPLDVLFLLDSTGSMADEINKIKSTLLSISHRVADLPSSPDLRFAMVSYRDRDDDYVTRIYDFDSNVNRFSNTIRDVAAHGGGDYPESLNEAFHKAVNVPEWRERDTVRLIILIADAPPHLDYGQDHSYATQMERARENGIKVHTIATSGLDEQESTYSGR